MSAVTFAFDDGTQATAGVDYDVDDSGNLLILDKVRTDHTARDIYQVPAGHWKWVVVNGLEA